MACVAKEVKLYLDSPPQMAACSVPVGPAVVDPEDSSDDEEDIDGFQ